MEYSENYNFNLPTADDDTIADIGVISENFKTIDEVMKQNSDLGVELNKKDEELQAQIDALEVGGGGATNLVNGSAKGSLRGIDAKAEDSEYTIGGYAVAIGSGTEASGYISYAEGRSTTASGYASHAKGTNTTASGINSHAEGDDSTASGNNSHAEGSGTTASGDISHAEGNHTTASGSASHAEGLGTIASSSEQHVQGRYNIKDESGKYAHIVGNGSFYYGSAHRSNAHTLDWDGNAWFAGDVYVGGKSQDDESATKLSSVATDITQVKEKLDGIEEGANKTVVDSELSTTSTNPIQNKVIVENLDKKVNLTNGTIQGAVDWNTLTKSGCYKIQRCTMTAEYNAPVDEYNLGVLQVSNTSGEYGVSQIYIPHKYPQKYSMYIRTNNSSTGYDAWTEWFGLYSSKQVGNLKNHTSFYASGITPNTVYMKLGKFTGNNTGGRAILKINGKQGGWNTKGDGGLKILTLTSNTAGTSSTDIYTGGTFYDFGHSNDTGTLVTDKTQDVEIVLVRANGYSTKEVDVYIKSPAYTSKSYLITVDNSDGCRWTTDVQEITTSDTDPTTNALSSFVVPKKQFASLEKVKNKADTETGTCTLTAYSNTVFGTVSNEILLNWARDTSKYYTTGSTNSDGTLTVQGTGNARIINAYNINATGTVGIEFAVSGTGAIKIEIKGDGTTYTSGNISLSTNTQKIQITHATSGITVLNDVEINIYASGETALKIENLLKMTEASTRTFTGNYDLIGNQVTVSVLVDNLQNGGEIALYPLPFVPKFAKSGVCGAFSSSSYSAVYYDIYSTTARIYLNDAPQASKQLTFYYTV